MGDIFALQDDITLAVVEALKLKLLGEERAAVLERYTNNAEAYELFLKGRYHSYRYTAQGWNRAIELFERAIAIEPDYALAYAGIAASRACLWYFGLLPAEQTIPQCKAATKQALAIDDGLADAHLSLALIAFFYDWEWQRADLAFKQAIALKPNNAEALSYYALFLAVVGRPDEALRQNRKALSLDPLAPLIGMNGGWTYFSAGMSAEASQQAAKMIEIDPDCYGGHWLQGAIHLSEGEFESAVERLRTAVSLGGHPVVIADFGSACALAGRDDEADAILRQLLEMRRQRYVPASCLARVYGRLGDIEKATEWVETAFAERNGADGMRTGNVETLKRSFHEQAILCGYLDDHLIAGPIAELYAWVDSNPAPAATGVPYECEVLGIDVTGRVATATVRETDHHGAVIDYFQLLRVGDSWSIVSKLWDAESPPP